ncbi:MAG: hypothetical protein GWN58_08105, partial [Anaerolineae bacterium]|nr:hypothetical protein [Anaerolineae bacterium]
MKGRIPLAWILAALVLLIGGSFRLSTLGWLPLAPKEASVALTAAADTELASPFWSPSQVPAEAAAPAYTNPTAALMSGLGADPAIARLVPALAGVIFMCLPLLLLRRLGWVRVLLSMLLLSISPTALTVSRSAGGEMLAALGLTLAAILLVRSRSPSPLEGTVAGVSLGAGIASGPAFWTGLFGFCLAYLLFRAFSRDDPFARVSRSLLLRRVVPTALLTALVLATWFGSRLGGLGDALAAAGSWIMGWTRAGGMPLLPGVFVFPIYEPLVLVMGTIAAVRGINPVGDEWRPPVFLGIGSLAAFVLYPSRSAADLIWVIMPAAVLAVGTIESTIERTVSREMP